MDEAGWLCDSCTQVAAVVFCACQGRETLLCEECRAAHNQKSLAQVHMTSPLSVYELKRPLGYFERLQERFISISDAKEEIKKSIIAIDACIATVNAEVSQVLDALRDFNASIVSELQQVKATLEKEISEGSAEVDSTMHEDEPDLQCDLARQIREFRGDLSTLKHFTFSVDSSRVLSDIMSLCVFSVATPIENEYLLPGIVDSDLFIYDAQTGEIDNHTLQNQFPSGFQLAFIERDVILVVGSTPLSARAYLIQLPSAKVVETREMEVPRRLPGLIVVGDFAYVFGGHCNSCEKYQISTYTWERLPDMKKEKTGYSPCVYENEIYLYRAIDNFEAFNLHSETFRVITAKGFALSNNNSLSVVVSEEVVFLTCSFEEISWNIESNTVTKTQTHSCHEKENPLSQCKPVLVGREVYYVSWYSGSIVSYSLDTKKFVKKA